MTKSLNQKMKPLIDFDVLKYEIGSCGQYVEDGELHIRDAEFVYKLLDDKIVEICEAVLNDAPPTLYISTDQKLIDLVNRRNKFLGEAPLEYKPNFREALAVTKPYKGTRKGDKPHHFYNLCLYAIDNYDVKLAIGLEADDLMSIDQIDALKKGEETVICTRDKDLRITPGYHYGWPCGKQLEFPLTLVDDLGWIEYNKAKKKIEGVGMKFFYSQMLTGDVVDNIPGAKGVGPVAAYKLLCDTESVVECKARVMSIYKEKYPENAREYFTEQANLLWMLRDFNEVRGWNNVV